MKYLALPSFFIQQLVKDGIISTYYVKREPSPWYWLKHLSKYRDRYVVKLISEFKFLLCIANNGGVTGNNLLFMFSFSFLRLLFSFCSLLLVDAHSLTTVILIRLPVGLK